MVTQVTKVMVTKGVMESLMCSHIVNTRQGQRVSMSVSKSRFIGSSRFKRLSFWVIMRVVLGAIMHGDWQKSRYGAALVLHSVRKGTNEVLVSPTPCGHQPRHQLCAM